MPYYASAASYIKIQTLIYNKIILKHAKDAEIIKAYIKVKTKHQHNQEKQKQTTTDNKQYRITHNNIITRKIEQVLNYLKTKYQISENIQDIQHILNLSFK